LHFYLSEKRDGECYLRHLKAINEELDSLKRDCDRIGTNFLDIFTILKKAHKFYPKLIDEYYWICITNGCDPKEIIDLMNAKVCPSL